MRTQDQANSNKHNLSIDSSVLIFCLSEDDEFKEECARTGRKITIMPSAARDALGTLLGNQPATWVLHQDQVTELKQVIEGLIVSSDQVLAKIIKPHPDQIYLDQEGIDNANELLTYLKSLENEMITRSERKDIIFGGLGSDNAVAAVELAKSLQEQVRRQCHTRELCDTTIYAFALINGNPYLRQINTLMHHDGDMEIIKEILEFHIGRVRQHKISTSYDDLDEPDSVLYRKFFYKNQGREKIPIIAAPNVVHLPPFVASASAVQRQSTTPRRVFLARGSRDNQPLRSGESP